MEELWDAEGIEDVAGLACFYTSGEQLDEHLVAECEQPSAATVDAAQACWRHAQAEAQMLFDVRARMIRNAAKPARAATERPVAQPDRPTAQP